MLKKIVLLSTVLAACTYALLPAVVVDQKMLHLSHTIGAETLIDLSVTDTNVIVGANPDTTTDTTVGDLGGHNNVPG